jgi:hypothetical protein
VNRGVRGMYLEVCAEVQSNRGWCHAQDSDPRHGSQGAAEPPQVLTCVQVRTGNNGERWKTGVDQWKSKEESNKGGEGIMMHIAR